MKIADQILRLAFHKHWKAQTDAYKNDRLTIAELSILQNDKLARLVRAAKANVPYYSDIAGISDVKEIGRLPLLTKGLIRDNVDRLKARNYLPTELKKNSTSGSSGDALHFYSDQKLDHLRQAIIMRGNFWAGYKFGDPLLLIWGSVADVNRTKNLKTKLAHSSLLFNQEMLSSFEMKESDMTNHVEVINNYKPTLITGYPSSLDVMSGFLADRSILKHAPKGIITSGETLFEYQRKNIEKAFGCKVMNRYGTREVGSIASECTHQNGLHVHQDHVVVEILNENQQPCAPGELGELVVTDLNNLGFPLIRYRIGDLAVKSDKPCSCGRPYQLLERVEGRVFDLIIGTNGNRVPGNYFTLYLRKIPGIDQFQVIQNKDLSMQILLISNESFDEAGKEKLISGLLEKLGADMSIQVKLVDHIKPTSSGKHRWVVSEASPFVQT
ncbi:MAG: phenylacetate-CoA ligase [Granulosicoccus sp.]|jgi:phenylacetate-CoA ligase